MITSTTPVCRQLPAGGARAPRRPAAWGWYFLPQVILAAKIRILSAFTPSIIRAELVAAPLCPAQRDAHKPRANSRLRGARAAGNSVQKDSAVRE